MGGQTSRKERAGAESYSTQRTAKTEHADADRKTGKRGSNGRARRVQVGKERGGGKGEGGRGNTKKQEKVGVEEAKTETGGSACLGCREED